MTNQALAQVVPPNFWPVLDVDQIEKVTEAAAKRELQAAQLAFDLQLKYVSGFHELPPRKRDAIWGQIEADVLVGKRVEHVPGPPDPMTGQPGPEVLVPYADMQAWFAAALKINAKEAAWLITDYLRFQREREA